MFPIVPLAAFSLREFCSTQSNNRDFQEVVGTSQRRLSDMLGAFKSTSQRDLLLQYNITEDSNIIKNHWTLSKEVAKALSIGEMRLESVSSSDVCTP